MKAYRPLILVLLGILAAVAAIEAYLGRFDLMESMRLFMGFFFLVFGFFKTLDWKGFAMAFSEYDILAKRSRNYAFMYPIIELALGVGYLGNIDPISTNIVTMVVMGVSSIGVIQTLAAKKKIHCACLGVVFKLPMTKITVIEDVGMGVMALIMLLWNL